MSPSPVTFPKLTPDLRHRIIAQVIETVRDKYVLADKAEQMAHHVTAQQAAGAFDSIETIPELTSRLTSEVHGVHRDLHLYLDPWLPPEDGGTTAHSYEDELRTMPRTNYDFRKLEVLLGNIGYLDLRSFCPAPIGGETATAAMQFLAHTDALIFDLRDNGGGDSLVQYLQSYLFAEPTHMVSQRHRSGRVQQTWTLPYVPGPDFSNHPVHVLISRSTFSAGEDFAYTLQKRGRAVIVGEKTRGGAHPVEFYRFPDLFLEIMIPESFSEHPDTGENWEETGVIPDIAVHADDALGVAHEGALRALLERHEEDESLVSFRQWALRSIASRRGRPQPTDDQLALYAGQYGHSVTVFVVENLLKLSWGGRRDHTLTPLGEHEFEFDHGTQRALFRVESGCSVEMIGREQGGGEWRLPRRG